MTIIRYVAFFLLLATSPLVHAHGDVHERIEDLTSKLEQHPENASQWIKRGRLYLDDYHASEARDDFAKALALAPTQYETLYYLAQAQLLLNDFVAAAGSIDKFIARAEHDAAKARGLMLQGDVRMAAKKPVDAAESYLAATRLAREVKPENFLKTSDAFLSGGDIVRALAVLNDGIARLGPLHALHEQALAIEINSKKYEDALRRVDQMLAGKQRTAHLLYKKGLILKALGRAELSRQTFQVALDEIDRLPAGRRNTPATESLRKTLLAETGTLLEK